MRRRIGVELLALVIVWLAACAAPAPTPAPNAVVHFRNFSGSALRVGVTSGTSTQQAILRPCGGDASFAVLGPPADDPRVIMGAGYDSTGAFDAAVSMAPAGPIDPDTLGPVSLTGIIWSTGNIGIADMPKWITFRSGTTDVAGWAPTDTPPPHCDPWPPSE